MVNRAVDTWGGWVSGWVGGVALIKFTAARDSVAHFMPDGIGSHD